MMNRPVLFVPDIHFGAHENDNIFLDYQFTSIDWLYQVAKKYDVKDIIFLGDIFDKRRTINLRILDKIQTKFFQEDFNHYYILGNHDAYYKNNNEINSLNVLLRSDNIYTDIPEEIIIQGKKFLMTPWINKENNEKTLEVIRNSNADYLCGHLDLRGFELMRGFLSEHSSIPLEELEKFDRVISGHYHCYSERDNITYLGSLCQLTWSDLNEDKFVGLLYPETGEFKLEKNPQNYYEIIKIKNLQLDIFDLEYYRNKKIKIYLYIDRKVKVEKFISAIVDIASSVTIIDEKVISNTANIDIEASKLTIQELWLAYLNELDMTDGDKKIINQIFTTTYTQVSTGNIDEIFEN
jgi:DNA repair exonuclease SbcCD nuclease subunit